MSLDKKNVICKAVAWCVVHSGYLIGLLFLYFPFHVPVNLYSLFGLPCYFRWFSLVIPLLFEITEWMIFSLSLFERLLPWICGSQKVGQDSFLSSRVKSCVLYFHSIHSRFSLVSWEVSLWGSWEWFIGNSWAGKLTPELHRLLKY